MRSCDACQTFTPIRKYKTVLSFPVLGLFEIFSIGFSAIEFAASSKKTSSGNIYLFIGVVLLQLLSVASVDTWQLLNRLMNITAVYYSAYKQTGKFMHCTEL